MWRGSSREPEVPSCLERRHWPLRLNYTAGSKLVVALWEKALPKHCKRRLGVIVSLWLSKN